MLRLYTAAGAHPLWSPDGTKLFFAPGPGQFSLGDTAYLPRHWDVAPDGRFVGLMQAGDSGREEIRIALNWFEELKRLAPTH